MLIEQHHIELFTYMFTAREIDSVEKEYTARGEAFFHVSGAGHESTGALSRHLIKEDWLHCHYRDKALMLARGISPEMFFLSLFAKDASHSKGRQMSAHLSSPEHNILSLVGPVGNNALQAAGIAHQIKNDKKNPLVLCAIGDGTSQEGEVLEAIAEAVRWQLPILFLVENNNLAISTKTTGMTFFDTPSGQQDSFYGIKIKRICASDSIQADKVFEQTVAKIRNNSQPAIIILEGERLHSHTNADDHSIYRNSDDIEKAHTDKDPLPNLEKWLLDNGLEKKIIDDIKEKAKINIRDVAKKSRISKEPLPCYDAKATLPNIMTKESYEYLGTSEREVTMLEAIKKVLHHHLKSNSQVTLYGEDIEDPKGDVFGLTRGLSTDFPNRVINSPLSESTIVGVGAGRALAGGLPVVFLQFADFLPIAFNQLISEIGSMYWRTDGAWQCPMIIMVTCGGYRPGLGPFHAQTLESIATHTPGIDVMMPSTAGDAAGLLNTAFQSNRPSVFFYPKSSLNSKNTLTSNDVELQRILLGKANKIHTGDDLSLISYGNCVSHCLDIAKILINEGIYCDVIDLRSLSPWDKETVINSAKKTKKVIVVHEDNITCSMSSEIGAVLNEELDNIKFRRVTRPDTYIPFHFGNQLDILPSRKKILEVACELLNLSVKWQKEKIQDSNITFINAMGTSPSDETILIIKWLINQGDTIEEGQILAEYEADKAAAQLLSPVAGKIINIIAQEDDRVKVGAPILEVKTNKKSIAKPIIKETLPKFKITALPQSTKITPDTKQTESIFIENIQSTLASVKITNKQILSNADDYSDEDIVRSTGIKNRYHINDEENAVSLGVSVAKKIIAEKNIKLDEIGMFIVSTGTTGEISTPSLACRILYELTKENHEIQAFDFNAACSGYLYGLQIAYDFLQQEPNKKVLFLTVEVLSSLLDKNDYKTKILFGDAATATLLTTKKTIDCKSFYKLQRPLLSSKPEPGKHLTVPSSSKSGYIKMEGNKVFSEGVRKMAQILKQSCHKHSKNLDDIDLLIAHQANQRILDAIQTRIEMPIEKIYSNIANYGNTSSNTIPLALQEVIESNKSYPTIALTAFGGGFTYGASFIEKERK